MKSTSSLLILSICLLISCTNAQNPLNGKWAFVNGHSNGNPTFTGEQNREKVFNENNGFYVSNKDQNGEHTTIKGTYKIIDKHHFTENLGNGVFATYKFHIKNDTLQFEGKLNIPSENNSKYRTVFIKETWVRLKN